MADAPRHDLTDVTTDELCQELWNRSDRMLLIRLFEKDDQRYDPTMWVKGLWTDVMGMARYAEHRAITECGNLEGWGEIRVVISGED